MSNISSEDLDEKDIKELSNLDDTIEQSEYLEEANLEAEDQDCAGSEQC